MCRHKPKWKAALVALAVSAFCGLLAATPNADIEHSDYLFGGEIVGYEDKPEPYRSFTRIFAFMASASLLGVWKTKPSTKPAST